MRFEASGDITIVNPNTVRLGIAKIASITQSGTTLTASDTNGIVSADDPSIAWAGVSELELPFPA